MPRVPPPAPRAPAFGGAPTLRGASAEALPEGRPPVAPSGEVSGEVSFVSSDERDATRRRLEAAGLLVADVPTGPPGAVAAVDRGRLGQAIDDAVERALAARGAAAPGALGVTDRDGVLGDQLFRARQAGAAGLAVVLGPLGAGDSPGALDADDSEALRFLAGATSERPVSLFLDARDATTLAYPAPVALERLMPRRRAGAEEPADGPDDHAWQTWAARLAEARGPQPLAALERLFCEAYVPLAGAIDLGLADARARRARDEFRDTFADGYVDAFATFAATTKRPRMVFDAYDLAARAARLHGARTVRLLLVDAMRWDVSRAVAERVAVRAGARAALADELLLWSSLPTTTMRQLETIGRGVGALRDPADLDAEPEPPRGRNAEHVRRLRVGARELHKLDLVEARVQAARGEVARALPGIADAAAEVIARHVESLAPRTLLLVFGDHGFVVDKAGVARQGGASPEEVIVGGFALLVGDVH